MAKKAEIRNKGVDQKPPDKIASYTGRERYNILTSSIAHDLNNILATISGYAEMLQEDLPDDSPHKEKTKRILSGVLRARSLTDQLLVISGQLNQKKISVNMIEVLKETVDFIRISLPSAVQLNSDIPQTSITISADPTYLFRIFINLLINAIQSMEEKGGTLSVGVRLTDYYHVKSLIKKNTTTKVYVIVTFKDTGPGINPMVMKKLFEPYFTTKNEKKGRGLGLSVVRRIINDLGGEIIVSSKENEGSVFDVYLPVIEELDI